MKTMLFTKQLSAMKRKFLKRANKYGRMDMDEFYINMKNGYIELHIYGEDEEGCYIHCSQEIEEYQDELNPLYFFVNGNLG